MSIEFSNTYQEVLFENLNAIIKQNFLLQTQLKILGDVGKQKEELQALNENLMNQLNAAREHITNLERYKVIADEYTADVQEKHRIQIALNEEMAKSFKLSELLDNKIDEISKLKSQISILEKNVAPSKLNKLNDVVQSNKTKNVKVLLQEKNQKKSEDGSAF